MWRLVRLAWLLPACLVVGSATARAQASITGTVRDSSGAVLPGVTVEASSPALIERVRSVVTDGGGQYRIVDLRPGLYAVTFTLQGFATVRREGIELTGDFTATVNVEMRVGALEETVTVTGESPIVDVQRTTQQRVFSHEVIDTLPVGRSHINLVVLVPGLSASQPGRGALADVGGTNNLQNTIFVIHGSRQSDTRLQFDGVRVGNILSEGQFSNWVPDTSSTQEITVDYAAVSAEQPFGGLRINIVPREGGNTFRGTMFATGVNSAWQGDNLTPELEARGLPEPNRMKRAYDINPSLGGPIFLDRLWFYSSARWQENQNYIAGLFHNRNAGDPTKWHYEPDISRQGIFSLTQKSVNTRLTWQVAAKHKVTLYADNQARIWDDGRAGVSPESTVAYRFPVLVMAQGGWTSPFTNRLLIEARFSHRGEAFGNQLPPEGDLYRTMIPVFEQSSGLHYRGKGGNGGVSGLFGYASQRIYTANATLSYVTGAHAFKVGFSDTWGRNISSSQSNDYNLYFRFNGGIPNQITQYARPIRGG
ncbi:MAG TPA: carboxypeptidase-like regulatory domain-containing protein, partial [Vicinamibacterales bacterium]|nr:carboxypeptidase-like regulatory domain-containing protein [Vicinamibacterales bacterium]